MYYGRMNLGGSGLLINNLIVTYVRTIPRGDRGTIAYYETSPTQLLLTRAGWMERETDAKRRSSVLTKNNNPKEVY